MGLKTASRALAVLLLVAGQAFCQLQMEARIVDVKQIVTTIERTVSSFEGQETAGAERVVGSQSRSSKAALLTVSAPATVTAYDQQFNPRVAQPVGPTSLLLAAPPGKYLLFATGEAGAATIAISIPPATAEPPADDPDLPAGLQTFVSEMADRLNDPPTRKRLAEYLAAVSFDQDVPAIVSSVSTAFERALAERTGASRKSDWALFRRALDEEMVNLKIETVAQFEAAIRSVIAGLKAG